MRPRGLLTTLASGVLVLAAAACGGDSGDAGASSEDLKEVSFITGFGLNAWDAPFAVAQEKGFYEEAGLKVELQAGQGGSSNLQLISSGESTFGHVGAVLLPAAVSDGMEVKGVASFFQVAGTGIIADPSIEIPQDLEGKSYAEAPYSFVAPFLPLYEDAIGIDGVDMVNVDPGSMPSIFLQGRVDAMSGIGWAEVPLVAAEGKEFNFFPFADAGLNVLGPVITTTTATLEDDPDTVKAFIEATQRGFAYTYENPEEAAEIAGKAWPTTKLDQNRAVVDTLVDYARTEATADNNLGWMSDSDWQQTVEMLADTDRADPIETTDLYENVLSE